MSTQVRTSAIQTALDQLYISGSRNSEDTGSTTDNASCHEVPPPYGHQTKEQYASRKAPPGDALSTPEFPSNLRAHRLVRNRRRLREQATRAFRNGDGYNQVVGTQAVLNRQKDEAHSAPKSGRCMCSFRKRKAKLHRRVLKTSELEVEDAETNIIVKLQQFHLPEIGSGTERQCRRDFRFRRSSETKRQRKFGVSGTVEREITLDEVQRFILRRNNCSTTETPPRHQLPRGVVRLEKLATAPRFHRKQDLARAQASSPFMNLSSFGIKLLRPNALDGFELRATAINDRSTCQLPPSNSSSSGGQTKLRHDSCTDVGNMHTDHPTENKLLDVVAHAKRPSNEYDAAVHAH